MRRCNEHDQCCENYEHCVACCQDPKNAPADLSTAYRGPDRLGPSLQVDSVGRECVLAQAGCYIPSSLRLSLLPAGQRQAHGLMYLGTAGIDVGHQASQRSMRMLTCPHLITAFQSQVIFSRLQHGCPMHAETVCKDLAKSGGINR